MKRYFLFFLFVSACFAQESQTAISTAMQRLTADITAAQGAIASLAGQVATLQGQVANLTTSLQQANCGWSIPPTGMSFTQATACLKPLSDDEFGTASGRNMNSLTALATKYNPYAIAGTAVINGEWERYQPFNATNFVFTATSLDLTAVIPPNGGLSDGGITSGQIASKATYQPGKTGATIYAFEERAQIPGAVGAWPAGWLYTQQAGVNDASEIDQEFFVTDEAKGGTQNSFDWTGYNHGPGAGIDLYAVMTNQYVWSPGYDFSAAYHLYQVIWTPTSVSKYVDGTLIRQTAFAWTSGGPAQYIVNLAVGFPSMTAMLPESKSEFPMKLSIDHIKAWSK